MFAIFKKKGWQLLRQSGSHMIIGKDNEHETIPNHKELSKGLEMILRKRLENGGK